LKPIESFAELDVKFYRNRVDKQRAGSPDPCLSRHLSHVTRHFPLLLFCNATRS
jgi:hypothetical protein